MKLTSKIGGAIQKHIVNKLMGMGVVQDTGKQASGERAYSGRESATLRQAAAEGIVLLKNDGALPLSGRVALFGRCQNDTYYVGYGSGGDVHPHCKTSILDGFLAAEREGRISLDETLVAEYGCWCKKHAPDEGFWGHWPMNYPEMPVSEGLLKKCEKTDTTAVVVLGRAAGEDRDNTLTKGSYYLTDSERRLLGAVTGAYERTVVVLNCGSILDFSFLGDYPVAALVCAFQGGMETGNALCDVLTGAVNPSGKLPDTVAKSYADYPSSATFGGKRFNEYREDIFVGYRYFETFEKNKVLFPFGFGLSYTTFSVECAAFRADGGGVFVKAIVTNTGSTAGKEVVQLYLGAPQGRLGKAARALVAFAKTEVLQPNESQVLELFCDTRALASFDDAGIYAPHSYVLEAGNYLFYLGTDVRSAREIGGFVQNEAAVVLALEGVCGVQKQFGRLVAREVNGKVVPKRENVPLTDYDLKKRILEAMPATNDGVKDCTFEDVLSGKVSPEQFVGGLGERELEALTRGFGIMSAPQGTAGNAGVYGGVIRSLEARGVPTVTATDGPAGIRLRAYAMLLPCGTALAASWNAPLTEELYSLVAREMARLGSDVLLAPGLNLHRNPLCGRNFEYFSEDPLLTGKLAAATVRGIQSMGGSACPKHFACNNQESKRRVNDSRVSERALRELYLRGFEICVKEGKPKCIMTSYNKVNGVWSHYNYDLATTVLRKEWGFDGLVMTDWWMKKSQSPEFGSLRDNAYRVRAQVDLYMPGNSGYLRRKYRSDGTLLKTLGKAGGITRGEIERCALNVVKNLLYHKNFVKNRAKKD